MGVDISHNFELNKYLGCTKCYSYDSYSEENQKINNQIKDKNNNNNKNINNFDTNKKINTLSPENEKLYCKNRLKKLIFEKHLSSVTNSSKTDLLNISAIQIQSFIRGFLMRKKIRQIILFNKLGNSNQKNENDSENEDIKSIGMEDNLVMSLSMNGTIFTGDNSYKSLRSTKSKLNKSNLDSDISRFYINKNILSFNLKSKNNIKYKYFGFLQQKNKQSHINTLLIMNNNNINTKIKNGFAKLIFEDNSIFKCNFIENKANGLGQYIDNLNNEEFIGEYKNNVPNGFGIYRNIISQRKCIGYFKVNGLNDIGIEESLEDAYTYQGQFDKNQKHGLGILHWKEGIKYEGEFYRGQMTGYAIIKYPRYKIYKGQMKNGVMDGFGEFNWIGGKKYLGYYKNDKRNGFGIFLWQIPKINIEEGLSDLNNVKGYIGFWSDGYMDGLGMKINDGKINIGLWKNGVKMEKIVDDEHIKMHIKKNQKQYLKLFLGTKQKILNLLSVCAIQDKDKIDEEAEFEMN